MFYSLLCCLLVHNAFSQNASILSPTPSYYADADWTPMSSSETVVVGFVFTLLFAAFAISWGALFYFRKGYHVDGRMPLLIWGMEFGLILWVSYCLGALVAPPPCWLSRMSVFCVFPIFGFFWVRALRLVFQWEISAKLNAFHSLPRAEKTSAELYSGRGGFFVQHRKWILPKYLYSIAIVYIAIHFGLCVEAANSLCPGPNLADCDLGCWIVSVRIMLIFFAELLVLLVAFCFTVRKENDSLRVRIELSAMVCYDVVAVAIGFFVFLFASRVATLIFISLVFTVCACITIWYPIILDIQMKRRHETRPPKITLATLLQHPSGFLSMAAFLKLEFSAENAYFYQCVEEFRLPTNRTQEMAEYLYETFLAPDSPFQVNISAPVARALAEKLNKTGPQSSVGRSLFSKTPQQRARSLSRSWEEMKTTTTQVNVTLASEEMASLFDDAQAEVIHLMERDSWMRYLQSPQFADYTREHLKNAHQFADTVEEKMRSETTHSKNSHNSDPSTHSVSESKEP